MTCKKHPTDLSSTAGVCASCLRERLFTLVAAQAQAQAQTHEYCRTQLPPPPLPFPRSVSPYVSRRKSDNSAWSRHSDNNLHCFLDQRFYSTPQLGPSGSVVIAGSLKKKHDRFSVFSHLFRSKSKKVNFVDITDSRDTHVASSSWPFWFSSMLNSNRKKQSPLFSVSESTEERNRRNRPSRNQGMFPARYTDEEEDCDRYCGGSSGYTSESSQGWKQTPRRTTADVRRGGSQIHSRNVSELAFGPSPLFRASPNRRLNQRTMSPDVPQPGDKKVHLGNASPLRKNRSKKPVDLGRFAHKR